MLTDDETALIQDYYASASSFLILLSPTPTFDQVAAALSLHLSLQSQKKPVEIICPEPMRVEFGSLVGVDQVKSNLGNHSLQVSFPYEENMVENVSYHIDKDTSRFHLIIRPHKGQRSIDPGQVEYSHVGVDADMMFLIGIKDWSDIPEYFASEGEALESANTVSMNSQKTSFAKLNIETHQHSSFCEFIFSACEQLGFPISSDIATNLFSGIEKTTDHFKNGRVDADTFEVCAKLLRAGARRPRVASATKAEQQSVSGLAEAFSKQLSKADIAKATQSSNFAPMSR